jgi:hypothetical protein
MFNPGRNIVFVCLCLTFSGVATAALSDLDRNRLADEVSTAKLNLDPNRFPQLDQSKAEAVRRIQIAKSFFQRTTSEQNYNAWMEYLDFDPLLESIEADTSAAAIGREALELRYRLVGTAPGLELTVLRNLRDSANRLVASIRFRDPEKSINTLTRQLGSLADRIRQLDERPSADDIAAISAMLDILSTSGQATNVVHSLRNTFSRPNVAVLVGEQLVQTVVSQNVNESRPVNDCILGTRIIGTATMNGQVSATLMPSTGAARINVALTGTVYSNNIGHNGPVRVRTSGVGQVFASRAMSINESGIDLDPVYVEARMQNQINSIEPKPWLGRRLIKKIASKKAAQQKPQTDRIANFKFRTQVTEQFTTQTNEQAATGIPDFMQDARPMLKRLSLVEPTRLWGSTENAIFIDATLRRSDQMTTVVSRPRITGLYAVAVQIHESAINNAATPILAGRTVNEQQLAELIEATGRELPIGDSDSEDSDSEDSDSEDSDSEDEEQSPFEITFSRLRPVIFEARDQLIRVGVRGTRFAQGSREIRRAMEISTVYKPQTLANGSVILKRVDEVGVDFPGDKRLSVSQAGLKSTIQKKFSRVFPETLLDQPLKVPDTVELEAIRGKVFQPRVVDAMNGWLTIAVQ